MVGKKALPVLLPNGVPPPQASKQPPPSNGQKQVLRVNRACNACRKQKMRCEGPDNPPCARCKTNGSQCIFEKIHKTDPDSNERLHKLETQFVAMQGTLNDILLELRNSSRKVPESPQQPSSATQSASPRNPQSEHGESHRSTGYQLPQQLPSLHSVLPHHYPQPGSTTGFPHRPTPHLAHLHTTHPHPPPRRRLPDPSSPYRPTLLSGITSAANSDDEGDIPSSALLAPIGVLNDLASVAAQSDAGSRHGLKRKRGEGSSPSGHSYRLAPSRSPHTSVGRSPYGAQSTPGTIASEASPGEPEAIGHVDEQELEEDEEKLAQEPKAEAVEEERSPERERDAIEKEIVSEEEAIELHRIYFTGCYRVLAVFNKCIDTLESLRARSPFLLNCILMTASKARDGGGPPSQTQMALVRECSCMAKEYLFGPLKSVEIVQGLLLIAGWSHSTGPTGWLAAGHAIRYGVELGLHKALPRLARRQSVAGADRMSETERALVVAARTWCGLYVFEYQISFGTGRPAMMKGDKSLIQARNILLKHPLSIPTDARLVSTCELMTLQSKIHDRLGPLDEAVDEDKVIETLRQSIIDLDDWLAEWSGIMGGLGLSAQDMEFFHSSAQIQLLYAHLFHHCIALRNLHTVADARALKPEMKVVALRAIDYAKYAIKVCLENEEYRLGLRYAISYSHTCAAFAGAFLLRLTRLFPQDLDVHAMIVMVDRLAHLLDEVPAGRFARSLFQMIKVSQARLRAKQGATPASDVDSSLQFNLGLGEQAPTPSLEYTNDFAHLVHPHPGVYELGGVANDITHGLLSTEGDWPEWIQTSIYGDLPFSGDSVYFGSGQADYSMHMPFAWGPTGHGTGG